MNRYKPPKPGQIYSTPKYPPPEPRFKLETKYHVWPANLNYLIFTSAIALFLLLN